MAHSHALTDSDISFNINPITRTIQNSSSKTTIIQNDHNSERLTFTLPKFIDGHDMSQCNAVQVHYLNIDSATKEQTAGIYEVDDLTVGKNSETVEFTWLISQNATKYVGSLNFVIRFSCVAGDGTVEYAWHTAVFSGISVSTGILNTEIIAEEYADILEQWKAEILSQIETGGSGGAPVTADGTVVSPNADFAEVAEWADGNPNNEDRTGYFVCANVPLDGIVMKKAKSTDDVKGVTISAPAFAGNYTKDKLDSNGNLLPQYSYVAIIGFVPVRDNGKCTVGGRCMPDDNGCAVPSSNSMGYQVVNRIDENRVLIIIEPNGDMVQRIKTKVQSKIGMWQPNTEYKVGDVVIANLEEVLVFEDNLYFPEPSRTIIAKCIGPHKSTTPFSLVNNTFGENVWEILQETKAYYDALGRGIHNTYATKDEVGNIETALDNIIAIQNQLIGGDAE